MNDNEDGSERNQEQEEPVSTPAVRGRIRYGDRKEWEMAVTQSHPWQCTLVMVTLFPLTPVACSYRVEVPARAKIGFPRDYRPGAVETRFEAGLSLWVVHD